VLLLVLAQVLLPRIAARRVRDRVAHYGSVQSASVSAFPAVELLWGNAESARVKAHNLRIAPAQIGSLLEEAHGMHNLHFGATTAELAIAGLGGGGPLKLHDVSFLKRGHRLYAQASLAQADLRAALPAGFDVQLLGASRAQPGTDGGEIRVRASGGLFGVRASVPALVGASQGKLVAQPEGFPLANLATITLFSAPHIYVTGVGASVITGPDGTLSWRLTMSANLL
jgi:hypothetical protein